MLNIILFGKPGSGKGTQAELLKRKYALIHLSTGDLFRYNIKNGTELGKLAQSYTDKGDLVPDAVTIKMLQAEMEKHTDANGFLFDGFPRTVAQAKVLDEFLTSKGTSITATIALDVEDSILVERILERGKNSGRTDDQDKEKIRNRFDEYNRKTAPLISFYKNRNTFYSVSGIGSIPEITSRLSTVIDNLTKK